MLFRSIFGGRSETNSKRVVTTTYFIPKLFVAFIIIYFLVMFAIEGKSIKTQETQTLINNVILNQDTSFIVSYNLDNADFEKNIELHEVQDKPSKIIKDNCDFMATIPMSGNINSLNASVSCGIILYLL